MFWNWNELDQLARSSSAPWWSILGPYEWRDDFVGAGTFKPACDATAAEAKGVVGADTKAGEALADTVVGADTKAGERAVAGESGAGTTTLAEGNAANAGASGATHGGAGNEFSKAHMSCWDMRAARALFRTFTCTCLTTSSTVLVSWLYSNKGKEGSPGVSAFV